MTKQHVHTHEIVREPGKSAYSEAVVDRKIETREYRDQNIPVPDKKPGRQTGPQIGLRSISIVPGDQYIGHLIAGPQFEARYDNGDPARFEDCQASQEECLLESIDSLREFLDEISGEDVDWRLSIASHPCPGAGDPDIPLIKALVERETTLGVAIEKVRQARREAAAALEDQPQQPIQVKSTINIEAKQRP